MATVRVIFTGSSVTIYVGRKVASADVALRSKYEIIDAVRWLLITYDVPMSEEDVETMLRDAGTFD